MRRDQCTAASAALASRRMRSTMERKPFERCGVRCSRKPKLLEQRDGVGREDVLGVLAGVQREQHGDQAAHDMGVAVAVESQHRAAARRSA